MKIRFILSAILISVLSCSCVLRGHRLEVLDARLQGHGVDAPVRIVYDSNGVPHISAESDVDMFYALGYIMAQDRFFYMDLMRSLGGGELCKLFGRPLRYKAYDLLTADKLLRSFDFQGRANRGVAVLDPSDRALLEAYARGVNRYLKDAGKRLPEYKALGVTPEFWSPEDSLLCMEVYGLSMTLWSLFHEYYGERLIRELGPEKAGLFRIESPEWGPYINEDLETTALPALHSLSRLLSRLGLLSGLGSNNWAVDGTMSASGKPVLANDPHVPHLLAPTFWYHVHLHGGSYDAAGLMFSGIPLMGAGTNGHVSWGITNARCDYIDLFKEKVDPDDPGRYFYKGEWREFEVVEETIEVKNSWDVDFTYRRSVHGQVIEEAVTTVDIPPLDNRVYALHLMEVWPERFLSGYLAIPKSMDAQDMRRAVEDMRMGPVAWNTVYATAEGDIGYLYSGHAPIRPDGQGYLPRTGTGEGDWIGWIPYEELPHTMNPEKHFIATANNKVEGPDYPYYLCSGYNLPSRAQRITELLSGREGLTARDMQDIQLDVKVMSAQRFVPLFLDDLEGSEEPGVKTCRRLLKQWSEQGFMAELDSAGTPVYKLIMKHMVGLTFDDELDGLTFKIDLAEMGVHALWEIMEEEDSEWFDKVDTEERETRRDLVREAAMEAHAYLTKKLGKDPDSWRWGDLHRLRLGTVFSLIPWNKDARIGTYPLPGTEESVNNSTSLFIGPIGYLSIAGPSSRIVVDMAKPGHLLFNATTGNSENPDSAMFDITSEDWARGRYRTLSMAPEEYEQGAMAELILEPR